MAKKYQSLEEAAKVIGDKPGKKVKVLSEIPDSSYGVKTAHLPGSYGAGKKRNLPLTIDDLTSPPVDRINQGQCAEIIEDFKEFFLKKHIPIYDVSEDDLAKKLKFVRIPGPPTLVEGLRELDYTNLSCIMAELPKPLSTSLSLYWLKPKAYVKNVEENIAYRRSALEAIHEYTRDVKKE